MMAKMFYTLDETKAALGKSEDEIKQLTKEGKLRELRDGPRLMFKADQVESLKMELGGLDQVDLGPSDTGAGIGLADSRGASGSGIALVDTGGASAMAQQLKDDSSAGTGVGLGGSATGMPFIPSDSSASGSGISVFNADEVERADPMAQTNIASISGQINLEGVGSGSGLLDLTRESDDTSLGAELLDEIAPSPGHLQSSGVETQLGESGTLVATDVGAGVAPILPAAARTAGPIVYEEAFDPASPAFGWACAAATLIVLFAMFVLISAVNGFHPGVLDTLAGYKFMVLSGIGLVLVIVCYVIGLIIGKASAR